MARKRGMQYIPYDYEAAYNKAMEDMHGEKSNHKSNDTQNCQTIKDHAPAPVIDNDTGSLHYSAKHHDSKTLCKSIQNHPDRKQQ